MALPNEVVFHCAGREHCRQFLRAELGLELRIGGVVDAAHTKSGRGNHKNGDAAPAAQEQFRIRPVLTHKPFGY